MWSARMPREPSRDCRPLPSAVSLARLIVRQPQAHRACEQADLWIAQLPAHVRSSNAMARRDLDEGLADERFIREHRGLPRVARRARDVHARLRGARHRRPARTSPRPAVVREAGVSGSCLHLGMGITQHVNGIHNAHALLNLSSAGQMGFPGSASHRCAARTTSRAAATAGCIPTTARLSALRRGHPGAVRGRWAAPPGRTGRVVTEMVEGCLTAPRARYTSSARPAAVRARFCTTRRRRSTS